jgi:hypothetical protein
VNLTLPIPKSVALVVLFGLGFLIIAANYASRVRYRDRILSRRAAAEVASLSQALKSLQRDTSNAIPDDLAIHALIRDPGYTGWRGPYLFIKGTPDSFRDPWGHAYSISTKSNRIMIRCHGPDGAANTPDDILSQ